MFCEKLVGATFSNSVLPGVPIADGIIVISGSHTCGAEREHRRMEQGFCYQNVSLSI